MNCDFRQIAEYFEAATPKRVLKALMALRGWSLEALGARTGVTKQAWSKAIRQDNFTALQILRLSRAFNVPAELFLPRDLDVPIPLSDEETEWMNAPMGPEDDNEYL